MADTGMVPDISPADMGARRDADLAATVAQLIAANPHGIDMNLPPALTDDGGS